MLNKLIEKYGQSITQLIYVLLCLLLLQVNIAGVVLAAYTVLRMVGVL